MIVILKYKDRYITKKLNMTWEEIMTKYRGHVISVKQNELH
jgi:hypothetical protein